MDQAGLASAKAALDALKDKGLTLALAESCTGGYVTHLLTSHPGSSAVLQGAIVAYSGEIKKSLLNIDIKLLSTHGTVSAQCSRAMAEGVLESMHTDAALSTTGVLGPDVIEGKSPGLVYISLALKGRQTITRQLTLSGNRDAIKQQAASTALDLLTQSITE